MWPDLPSVRGWRRFPAPEVSPHALSPEPDASRERHLALSSCPEIQWSLAITCCCWSSRSTPSAETSISLNKKVDSSSSARSL